MSCFSEAGHGIHAAETHSVPPSQIQVCAMCVSQNQHLAVAVYFSRIHDVIPDIIYRTLNVDIKHFMKYST